MLADVGVDGGVIVLIDHAEFNFLGLRFAGEAVGDDKVERDLDDGGVGDGFDAVEGDEEEGFLEAEEDALGEEEEIACGSVSACK